MNDRTEQRSCIMLIDDSETIRRTASTFLTEADYMVVLAENGLDALAKLATCTPDIIFSDVVMPKLDGFDTVTLIRDNPMFSDTPIVMLTSKGGVFDIAKGKFVGCNDYLVKPFTKETLIDAVTRFIKVKATETGGRA